MSNSKPYSETHPELKPGERWMCNVLDSAITGLWEGDPVGWATARIGSIAYWDDGSVAEGLRPLFADEEEVNAAPEHVGLNGTVLIRHEAYVPYHEAEMYQLVRVEGAIAQ